MEIVTYPIMIHSSLVVVMIFFLIFHAFPKYVRGMDFRYAACNSAVECGRLGKIQYPFWVNGSQPNYCGHPWFELRCLKDEAFMWIRPEFFHVIGIDNRTRTLKIARFRDPFTGNIDCPYFNMTQEYSSVSTTFFSYTSSSSDVKMIAVLHSCPLIEALSSYEYPCSVVNNNQSHSYFVPKEYLANRFVSKCGYIALLPVLRSAAEGLLNRSLNVGEALSKEFEFRWTTNETQCEECIESGGICGYDWNFNTPSCFCPADKSGGHFCSSKSLNISKKIILATTAAGGVGILFAIMLIVFSFKRKAIEHRLMLRSHANQNIEEFVRNYGSQAPKRYSYSDVRKMTDSFKDKLGQGGYGGVYKGKLADGRLVAVKVLNTSKGNGEEFINEVASISRTSHVNVVSLLGFCFECGKKALIYEFMSSGSLENFLCSETPLKASKHLGWEKLYQIAVGVARGLEYLHCGCRTRILHFDVKPHNILLDQDFTPKISDFGLAKLCPPKGSIVSMSAARGTIGYVAPEVFSRNFGRVSHKSDVYSYGMMILEIVGGRQKVNGTVDNSSETYFPHWIYKRLEQQVDLGLELEGIENKEENEVTRKMIVVGLWCIQTDPSHRPCMSKVIEMLEGSIEALQIPPKPFLSSPPRFPLEYSSSFKSTLS